MLVWMTEKIVYVAMEKFARPLAPSFRSSIFPNIYIPAPLKYKSFGLITSHLINGFLAYFLMLNYVWTYLLVWQQQNFSE